ncbi:vWFA domain-containing protein [Naegleria gruberi]|uniref:VWFA domain-containing protein n=1 Tax=Naegleria gruberi TaxID=5762 RepID=D2V5B4_NAEGR|nr:vWFA domain-containing protein [Naegleria gruberi]EFC48081.1 vWFA domain-containing protein [Naegleria gruberi]|eukprot:XP_002680825.1 vWFA domain-containing protein [Naegleria gruberi strain NEG-M]
MDLYIPSDLNNCDDDFCDEMLPVEEKLERRMDELTILDGDAFVSNTTSNSQTTGAWIRAKHLEEEGYDQELVDHSENFVDLVIVMDCTGSMSGEIEVAKRTVTTIISTLHEKFQSDLRFSAVSYRDHTDDYAVKEFPFTKDLNKAKGYINTMSAQGGGDHPEALASALYVINEMPFNKKGKKIVVWVADAPPHGMKTSSDSYPEGCKDQQGNVIDWIKLGSALQEKNVVFYGILCERAKDDQQLTLFMDYLTTKTDGKCLLLTDANKIPNLVINGCVEDEDMDNLVAKKIKELGEEKVNNLGMDDLLKLIHNETSSEKVAQVKTFEIASTRTKNLMNYSTLSDMQCDDYVSAQNVMTRNDDCEAESDSFDDYGGVYYKAPTMEKVAKAYSRNLRK